MSTISVNENNKSINNEEIKKINMDRTNFRKKYKEHKEKYPNFDQDLGEAWEFLKTSKVGKYMESSAADFMELSVKFYLSYPRNEQNVREYIEEYIKDLTMFKYIKISYSITSYDSLYLPTSRKYSVSINEIKTKGFESKDGEISICNNYFFGRTKSKTTWSSCLVSSLITIVSYFYSLYYKDIYIEYNSEYKCSHKFRDNELEIILSIPHSNSYNCLTMAASSRIITIPWYITNVKIHVEYYLI